MASFLSASLPPNIGTWLKEKKEALPLVYKWKKKSVFRKPKCNLLENIWVRDPQSAVNESAAIPEETW